MFSIHQWMVRNWTKSVDEIAKIQEDRKEQISDLIVQKKENESNAVELVNGAKPPHFIGELKNVSINLNNSSY